MGSIFHIKINEIFWSYEKIMRIIKIIKIKCFYPPLILEEHERNSDASILVYKHSPERTGFHMYAENTQQQLTFLALLP